MKAIWDDMFFDIEEGNDTKEIAAMRVGELIKDDLRRIEYAIEALETKKALVFIKELKESL